MIFLAFLFMILFASFLGTWLADLLIGWLEKRKELKANLRLEYRLTRKAWAAIDKTTLD